MLMEAPAQAYCATKAVAGTMMVKKSSWMSNIRPVSILSQMLFTMR